MDFLYFWYVLIFIVSQQVRYLKRQDLHTYTYYCPYHHTFGCPVQIRLDFSKYKCDMYGHGQHTMQSHKEKICKHTGRDDLMQEQQCGNVVGGNLVARGTCLRSFAVLPKMA